MFKIIGVSLLLFLFGIFPVSGQHPVFKNFGLSEGLVQSQPYAITQDSIGNLWVATLGGLSRFDGKRFTNYTRSEGLQDNIVFNLAYDRQKVMWIGSMKGLSRYDGITFKNIPFLPKKKASNITSVIIDKSGQLWATSPARLCKLVNDTLIQQKPFTTADEKVMKLFKFLNGDIGVIVDGNKIYKYNNRQWTQVVHVANEIPFFTTVFEDAKGYLWLLSEKKLGYYKNRKYTDVSIQENIREKDLLLTDINESPNGTIWVGTSKGLVLLKSNGRVQHLNQQNGFTDLSVKDIFVDRSGNIWIGVDGGGLYRHGKESIELVNNMDGLPNHVVMSVWKDETKQQVWMGTNGYGVYVADAAGINPIHLKLKDKIPSLITAIVSNRKEEVWVGSYDGGLWKIVGSNRSLVEPLGDKNSKYISGATSANALFFAALNGLYIHRNNTWRKIATEGMFINTIAPVNDSVAFLGTRAGLFLLKDNQLIRVFSNGITADMSVVAMVINHSHIWAGTESQGIFMINQQSGEIKNITEGTVLRGQDIYSMIRTADGTIWAGTSKGLAQCTSMSENNYRIRFFGDNYLFANAESNQGALTRANDGTLLLGTTSGLFYVKESLMNANQSPLSLHIESVQLNSGDQGNQTSHQSIVNWYHLPVKPMVPYSDNKIDFRFGVTDLSGENLYQYQYYIEGFEKKYSNQSVSGQVTYTNLPPGDYTFKAKAINVNLGAVSNELAFQFSVETPFHKTTGFYILAIVFLIILAIFSHKAYYHLQFKKAQRIEQIRQAEEDKIRKRTAQDFHDELGNKLTRIKLLTEVLNSTMKEQSDAKKLIQQIHDNAQALYSGAKEVIWSLGGNDISAYDLLIHMSSFTAELLENSNISFEMSSIPQSLSGITLNKEQNRQLMMIAKEVINNAVKHAECNNISISVSAKLVDEFELIIEDDGIGFDMTKVKSMSGIANIQQRASRLPVVLSIETAPGEGTVYYINYKNSST